MTRMSGHPKWLSDGRVIDLEPVPLTERHIEEAWLQAHLDAHPELIPIADVGSSWGPLVSLGREIETVAGLIDNLFVSPDGDLTVVETKLWRNPQARREVVGQVLDYAAALQQLSYEQLDALVATNDPDGGGIYERVRRAHNVDEPTLIDAIDRNLRRGSFLLLVVGDGVRENVENLAGLLRQHPGLRFHLDLIELRLFRPRGGRDDEFLIVPSLVAHTKEITRAVVDVRHDRAGGVTVEVTPSEPEDEETGDPIIRTLEEFERRETEVAGPEAAAATVALANWWIERGGLIRFRGTKSINFAAPYSPLTDNHVSVMTAYLGGYMEGSVKSLCTWQEVAPTEDVAERFREAGFERGSADWPRRTVDLSQLGELERFQELLSWVGDRVAEAEARLQQ